MFRKINNRKLSVLFIALLLIVIIITLIDLKKGDRSFTKNLVPIDTASIERINIIGNNGLDKIILEKVEKNWKVKKEQQNYQADKSKMNGILGLLNNMETSGVISDSEEKWADFNVTDSTGIRVEVFDKKKKRADFIIGRFNYKPNNNNMYSYYGRQSGSFKTYVRPFKEKKVYTVDEMLTMSFNTDFNSYRNHTLVRLNPEDIVKVTFSYPADSSFVLQKNNEKWTVNNIEADSAKVVNYINMFRNMTHSWFVDKKPEGTSPYTINIEGNNIVQPVVINANINESNKHVVLTTMNTEAYFDGDESDLFTRLFISKNKFLKEE